jgi:hypothetical protein
MTGALSGGGQRRKKRVVGRIMGDEGEHLKTTTVRERRNNYGQGMRSVGKGEEVEP